jgi:hypothetical protein
MKIGDKLLKQLSKIYTPSATIPLQFGRYDLVIKTDDSGNPILLFIGKENEEGIIKGERFSRVLIKNPDGKVIKDHWDNKGKV